MTEFQIISVIALALSTAYVFLIMYLLSHEPPKKHEITKLPKISLLVAFRNEQKNIISCCEALNNLDYPKELLEILMLNDKSKDNSPTLVKNYISDKNNFQLIHIEDEKNNLRAKMNVLAQGIPISSGEFIFVTDADCKPSTGWLKTMIQYFDNSTAMVSGFTILDEDQNIFSMLQKLDWIFLQGLAFSASNSNNPITVIGNNLAFRRNIYNQVGGFEAIGFSVTEDFALMKSILKKTNKKVKYIRDKDGLVFSLPEKNFGGFIKQRLRWIRGGLGGSSFAFALIILSFLVHISILVLFALAQWNAVSATAIGLIVGIDYFQFKKHLKSLGFENLKRHFVKYEIFFIFYPIILFLIFPFSKKISWKGRNL